MDTSSSPLNLRPSQSPTDPTPEPSISSLSGPSIASLSAPSSNPSIPTQTSPLITAADPPRTKSPKPPKPHKPKNIPLIVGLSIFGALVLAFSGYFVYFYYLSGSFTPASTTQTATQPSSQQDSPTNPTSEPTDSTSTNPTNSTDTPADTIPDSASSTPEPTRLISAADDAGKIFSRLSGEPLTSLGEDSAPTFCVQIPNGVDGARPQVGLSSAKVVFEAIAESGITRFAAVFQAPPALIGPIRSLRIYYLNWDTPFDCVVVHAGGADDALSALRSNNYRELDESQDYMFRDFSNSTRLWNNLFATGTALSSFAQNMGYLSSDIKSFPRLKPAEAEIAKIRAQATHPLVIDQPADGDTSELRPKITTIALKFGEMPTFNPVYTYDPATNSYHRAYESGNPHTALDCSTLDSATTLTSIPTTGCPEVQLSPTTVIAMIVQESRATYDNYHESISSIGAGDAYIFQNGGVTIGTWEKSSASAQIIFRDKNDQEISLVPGQTWISAIPAYGAVSYE